MIRYKKENKFNERKIQGHTLSSVDCLKRQDSDII